jgi:GTP diphosphokinase / guanosine-3',5'-bis(diphosphate) 3'-diphosphatase
MDSTGLILRALEFAAFRHRNQTRKGKDKSPYINHPIQVANLLANEGGEKDPVLLTAAILHDIIEDTVDTPEEKLELTKQISEIFGEQVLSVTLEVTDDKSLEKQDRKQLQIEEAPYKSDNAKKLKIADKIMNVRDITDNPPVGWPVKRIMEYFDWAEKVVAGLRGVNKKLEDIFDECLRNGRLKYGNKKHRGFLHKFVFKLSQVTVSENNL